MDLDALRAELRRDEGLPGGKPALKPYRDTVGKLTIGFGRNLDDVGISRLEAEDLLENDIVQRIGELSAKLFWFAAMDPVRARVLVNMAFNLGTEGLLGFHDMLDACRNQQWDAAARALRASKYAPQVGARADRLETLLRTGVAA